MATTITAGNATNGAAISSDNTGILELKTGSGAGTTALTLGTTGNVNFPILGQRITGDFSNATFANRVMFQNSTTNGRTNISALPNGTSTTAGVDLYGSSSDLANTSLFRIANTNAEYQLEGTRSGTGNYLPMVFYTGGSEQLRIGTSGQLGIGGANYGTSGQVLTSGGSGAAPSWVTPVTPTADVQTFNSSGTWTKPASGQFVRIQMWGGGSGGNRDSVANSAGGGGGGGYTEVTVPIASMGATAAVTVGAGGAGRTGSAGIGTAGGNSGVTLGNGVTIYVSGGRAAVATNFGGNGGYGGLVTSTTQVADPTGLGAGANDSGVNREGFTYTGGGGGGGGAGNAGGYSGWGGGGGTAGTGAGGTSLLGGAGGNASTNGTAPGGAGGASTAANVNGTNGAAGRVIITTY